MSFRIPNFLLITFGLLSLILFFLWLNGNKNSVINESTYEFKQIQIGSSVISAQVADTRQMQELGLGKRAKLEENSGMIFPYEGKTIPYFWMKDMAFPIDIIWISDNKIVGIEKNVPEPKNSTFNHQLPTYSPLVPIDNVLEVNAGFSDKNNIKVGDEVRIE